MGATYGPIRGTSDDSSVEDMAPAIQHSTPETVHHSNLETHHIARIPKPFITRIAQLRYTLSHQGTCQYRQAFHSTSWLALLCTVMYYSVLTVLYCTVYSIGLADLMWPLPPNLIMLW